MQYWKNSMNSKGASFDKRLSLKNEEIDLVIVGAGPAGLSLALHLIQISPNWSSRILIIEKRIHPRKKLCGGALSIPALEILDDLGIQPNQDTFPVNEIQIRYGKHGYALKGKPVLKIVNRATFDHFLLDTLRTKGVQILEDTSFISADRSLNGYCIETTRGKISCRTLVGADGSTSIVRKTLGLKDQNTVCRLLEVLTPVRPQDEYLFNEKIVNLEFKSMSQGLQGYYWDFPSIVNGTRMVNRGIFDSRANPNGSRADLKQILKETLLERGIQLDKCDLQGHPLNCWNKNNVIAKPNALLIGDAAGGDALFGEGISFALGYGRSAAKIIETAFNTDNFDFKNYQNVLLENKLFRHLNFRSSISKFAYTITSPFILNICWFIVSTIVKIFPIDNPFYLSLDKKRVDECS